GCHDDCRLPPFRLACMANIVRLGIRLRPSNYRGIGPTITCRPCQRAGKRRGAVPAGQGFVSANSLRPRAYAAEVLFGSWLHRADGATRLDEYPATTFPLPSRHETVLFAITTRKPVLRLPKKAWP